jgi:hypothetical protein
MTIGQRSTRREIPHNLLPQSSSQRKRKERGILYFIPSRHANTTRNNRTHKKESLNNPLLFMPQEERMAIIYAVVARGSVVLAGDFIFFIPCFLLFCVTFLAYCIILLSH